MLKTNNEFVVAIIYCGGTNSVSIFTRPLLLYHLSYSIPLNFFLQSSLLLFILITTKNNNILFFLTDDNLNPSSYITIIISRLFIVVTMNEEMKTTTVAATTTTTHPGTTTTTLSSHCLIRLTKRSIPLQNRIEHVFHPQPFIFQSQKERYHPV